MADNVENQTIRLLQELRSHIDKRFDEVAERFDDADRRMDGISYIMTMMAADMSQNDDRIDALEELTAKLEEKNKDLP